MVYVEIYEGDERSTFLPFWMNFQRPHSNVAEMDRALKRYNAILEYDEKKRRSHLAFRHEEDAVLFVLTYS